MNTSSADSVQSESSAAKGEPLLSAATESLPELQTEHIDAPSREKFWLRLKPQMRRDARLIGMMLAIKAVCMVFAVQSFHVWADQPVGPLRFGVARTGYSTKLQNFYPNAFGLLWSLPYVWIEGGSGS